MFEDIMVERGVTLCRGDPWPAGQAAVSYLYAANIPN